MEVGKDAEKFPFDSLPSELFWRIVRFALPDEIPIPPKEGVLHVGTYVHKGVNAVGLSSCGNVLSGGGNKQVKIARLDGTILAQYTHDGCVKAVCFSPDGRYVASGGEGGEVKIARSDGTIIAEYAHDGCVAEVRFFPDSSGVVSCGGNKVKRANLEGTVLAEYTHYLVRSAGYTAEGIISEGGNRVMVARPDGTVLRQCALEDWLKQDGYLREVRHRPRGVGEKKVTIIGSDGAILAECPLGGIVKSIGFLGGGMYIVSGVNDNNVTIKALTPLLLAQHQLKEPTLSKFLLLKRLQEKLLKDKKPLFIGQADRSTLERMPKLKELLKIEKSTSKTVNPIWRVQLKYQRAHDQHGRCSVM